MRFDTGYGALRSLAGLGVGFMRLPGAAVESWRHASWSWSEGLLIVLLVCAAVWRFRDTRMSAWRWSCLVALVGAMLMIPSAGRGALLPAVALSTPVVVSLFLGFAEADEFPDLFRTIALPWCVAFLLSLGTLLAMMFPRPNYPYPPVHAPLTRYVAGIAGEAEAVCTDVPWATAWYANRLSILLPRKPDSIVAMSDRLGVRVPVVYLTQRTTDLRRASELTDGAWSEYRGWLDGRMTAGLPWTDGMFLPPGTQQQLVVAVPGRLRAKREEPSAKSEE